MSTVQLEKLEIVMEIDSSDVNKSLDKIASKLEGTVNRIKRATDRNSGDIERNLSFSQPMNKNIAKATQMASKVSQSLRKITTNTNNTGKAIKKSNNVMSQSMNKVSRTFQNAERNISQSMFKMGSATKAAARELENVERSLAGNSVEVAKTKQSIRLLQKEYKQLALTLSTVTEADRSNVVDQLMEKSKVIQGLNKHLNTLLQVNSQLTDSQQELSHAIDSAATGKERFIQIISQMAGRTANLAKNLGSVIQGLRTTETSTRKTNKNFSFMAKLLQRLKKSKLNFANVFSRTSKQMVAGSKQTNTNFRGLARTLDLLMRRVLVFNLMHRGLIALTQGLGRALMANDAFSASLNQIRGNLLTAFYPIFQAVLPAINALMSALARVTGYLATFISMLFGTTFAASRAGAEGLYNASQNVDGLGNSARGAREDLEELQKSLMGFDEINRLDGDNNRGSGGLDDGGGIGGIDWGGIIDPGVPAWLQNIMDLLDRFFEPIRRAWERYGYRVIREWQHMLREVSGLVIAIGRSFMEVWENGTGERFVGNLLNLLANVLGIVGDIAKAFRLAWEENDRGTALIQAIFDALNAVLEILIDITQTFRDIWNDNMGVAIASNLLEIFTNLANIIANLGQGFREAWAENESGHRIVEGILGILNDILTRINNITNATQDWARNLDLSPLLNSIATLLESLQPLANRIGAGLEWFFVNVLLPLAGFTISQLIPTFLDTLASLLDLLGTILQAFRPHAEWLWDNFLQRIAQWSANQIISSLERLTETFRALSTWIEQNEELFRIIIYILGTLLLGALIKLKTPLALVKVAFKALEPVIKFIENAFKLLKAMVDIVIYVFKFLYKWAIKPLVTILKGALSIAFKGAMALIAGIKVPISLVIAIIVIMIVYWNDLKDAVITIWNDVSRSVRNVLDNLATFLRSSWEAITRNITDQSNRIRTSVVNAWNNIRQGTSEIFEAIREFIINIWNRIRDGIMERVNHVRDRAVGAWNTMRNRLAEIWEEIRLAVNMSLDRIMTPINNLGNRISTALTRANTAVRNGARNMMNGLINGVEGGLNRVINGANRVLGRFNSNWSISTVSINRFAQGTGPGGAPGGLAYVGDGGMSELVIYPNGQAFLSPDTDTLVNLPKGTEVVSGPETKQLFGGNIPKFAGGTGGWVSRVINGAANIWDNITDRFSISRLLDGFVNRAIPGGVPGGMPRQMFSSAINRVWDSSVGWLFSRSSRYRPDGEYENGGLITNEGLYRLGERGLNELVIPLDKPGIASQLMDYANGYLGRDGSISLGIPDRFRNNSISQPLDATTNEMRGHMSNAQNDRERSLFNQIMNAVNASNNTSQGESTIVLQVDGTTLGRVTIKELNRITQQSGVFPLNFN